MRPNESSRLRDRTPRIKAIVRDIQNDLARPDLKLYVDGRAKSFSYNRSTNRLAYTTGRLSFGRHAARIVVRDEMGLARTSSWRFEVIR